MPTLEKMRKRLTKLAEALERGDVAEVERKGEAFINSVDEAWELYNRDEIETEEKALTKVMYLFVKEELPRMLKDPSHYADILIELRRFRRVMDSVLKPQEKTSGGQNA